MNFEELAGAVGGLWCLTSPTTKLATLLRSPRQSEGASRRQRGQLEHELGVIYRVRWTRWTR